MVQESLGNNIERFNMKEKTTAIILAAGKGKRMQSDIPKQYLEINGKMILYYTLKQFQESSFIDEIIIVVGEGEKDFCKEKIIDKYGLKKVTEVVVGGKERYHSVYNGLQKVSRETEYIFIHDGARPFITQEILERAWISVKKYKACVVGMPTKDTIKIANENQQIKATPDRSKVWLVHTPQVFEKKLIQTAYEKIMSCEDDTITDDAMVVEKTMQHPIQLIEGSYKNIKITTPEDLELAKIYLR